MITGSVLASVGLASADEADDVSLDEVRTADSTHVDHGIVSFSVSVTNQGDEPVTVPVTLEIAYFEEEIGTLELEPGETGRAYESFDPRSLGPGEHEWTVTAADETETGTLFVDADDDYEGGDEGYFLEVHSWNDEDDVIHVDECRETVTPGFDMTVVNYHYDAAETTLTFEIDGETEEIPLEFDPRESKHVYASRELGVGRYEWTVTIGDQTETSQLRIAPEQADN